MTRLPSLVPPWRVWRARVWLWAPPLAFFLLNLGLASAYRFVYAGQGEALARRLEQRTDELERLASRAAQVADLLARANRNRSLIEEFHRERLATEPERLTAALAEVKELARRVGLQPGAISYPEEVLAEMGLRRRTVAFAVEGTYAQLRQFVNLLELSNRFLALHEVSLTEAAPAGARLRILLRIHTLFSEAGAPPPRPVRSGGRS